MTWQRLERHWLFVPSEEIWFAVNNEVLGNEPKTRYLDRRQYFCQSGTRDI